ncbi:MAG: cobalamin-dependent protein, partial [Candidatus Omnitrophica bacterium]|nr:cobalamin-dependent protein [Candidatus Omnitrophota bacterium]
MLIMAIVMLVHPPAEKHVCSYSPQVNASEEGIGFKAPLGLLYIATYLKDQLKNAVDPRVIDCPAEQLNISACVKKIVDAKPDIVGISAWSDFWYSAFKVGEEIKKKLPAGFIVYGGPHIAIYPEITLNIPHVDAVIVGDGEVPFYRLVKKISERESHRESQDGLHFKESGINKNSLFYIEKDLDHLSIPDRALVDITKYNSLLFKGEYSSTMITSRGCPYR